MEVLLWILIGAAVLAVIIKKVKDIKKGKFCSCGCENCPAKCKAKEDF